MNRTEFTAEPGKQETFYSRHFDASPQLVFTAYTDSERIKQWWGPRDLRTIIETNEVRQGGRWRFIHRDAEGREFKFFGVYHRADAPGCIVSTFEFEGMPGRVLLETLTLEPEGTGTRLTAHTVYPSVADRDAMLDTGMEKGLAESMDRLAELLAKLQPVGAGTR